MPIIQWKPFIDPFEEMERMLEPMRFAPAVDVYEKDGKVVVEAPLAGVDPKDVEVSFDNGCVIISGSSEQKNEIDEKNFYRKEVRRGSFYRRIPLPAAVKEDKAEAVSENGILKVIIPKAANAPQAKKLKIKVKK